MKKDTIINVSIKWAIFNPILTPLFFINADNNPKIPKIIFNIPKVIPVEKIKWLRYKKDLISIEKAETKKYINIIIPIAI